MGERLRICVVLIPIELRQLTIRATHNQTVRIGSKRVGGDLSVDMAIPFRGTEVVTVAKCLEGPEVDKVSQARCRQSFRLRTLQGYFVAAASDAEIVEAYSQSTTSAPEQISILGVSLLSYNLCQSGYFSDSPT